MIYRFVLLGTFVFVLGLGAAPGMAQTFEYSIERGSTKLHRPALVDQLNRFLGPSIPTLDDPSFDFGGDTSGGTSGRSVQVESQTQLAFSIQASTQRQIIPGWAAVFDASLSVGEGAYFLPRGAAPFDDPITLRFTYLAVQPRAGLRWSPNHRHPDWLYIQAGLGHEQAFVQSSMTSLLLDVHDSGFQGANFAYAEAAWAPDWANAARFEVGLTYTKNKDSGLALSVNFPID